MPRARAIAPNCPDAVGGHLADDPADAWLDVAHSRTDANDEAASRQLDLERRPLALHRGAESGEPP